MVSGNEVFVRCNGLGYKKSWGIEGAWTKWKYKLEISQIFCKLLRQMVRHPGQSLTVSLEKSQLQPLHHLLAVPPMRLHRLLFTNGDKLPGIVS
ncbi:hypothetical protein VNO80_29097 [Phaseolus coccineus]|uniref:Uncharacterized protein n=1 Tax=Phaseolus coccineus TaxID=3886 RepID=A0AAN9QEP0_PHACN